MVLPIPSSTEFSPAEESGEGDEGGAGDSLEGAEAAVPSVPGSASSRESSRKDHDGDRQRVERICMGNRLRGDGLATRERVVSGRGGHEQPGSPPLLPRRAVPWGFEGDGDDRDPVIKKVMGWGKRV